MTAEFDFSPPLRPRAAGAIGAYVAIEMASGRTLLEALRDDFVQDELDAHPFLLDELAADPAVRAALAMSVVTTDAVGGLLRMEPPPPARSLAA